MGICPLGVTIYRVTPYSLAIHFEEIPSCFVLNELLWLLWIKWSKLGSYLHNTNIWGNFGQNVGIGLYCSNHKNNNRNGLSAHKIAKNELLHEMAAKWSYIGFNPIRGKYTEICEFYLFEFYLDQNIYYLEM